MRILYLGITILFLLLLYIFRKKICNLSYGIVSQLLYIFSIFSLFYVTALLSKSSIKTEIYWIILDGIFILVPFFIFLILSVMKKKKILNIPKKINLFKIKILIIALTLISRIWLIDSIQSWDSSEYYFAIMKACQNFDFAPSSFLKYFQLLAHPSYGYALFTSIGEFILPENVRGVLSVSLILTCFVQVKIYYLFRQYFGKLTSIQAFLGSILCLTLPLYWGTFSCVMPDYLMTLFLILVIYYESKGKWILSFFWGLMVCFSKEIGIVILAGYYSFKVLYSIVKTSSGIKKQIISTLKQPSTLVGILLGICFLGYTIINKSVSTWSHSVYYSAPFTWSANSNLSYNTFGIQKDNIITRLLQYFVCNFFWIISLTIILLIILLLVKIKRRNNIVNVDNVVGIIGVLSFYGIFMCIYITSGSMRYNVVFSVLYLIIGYLLIIEVVSEKSVIYFASICIIIFTAQSFRSVDFVTNFLFGTKDMGEAKMTCISQKENLNPGGDYYIYNLQYRAFDKNLEKMLVEIDYQQSDTLLIAGNNYIETVTNSTIASINGRHQDKKWDPEKKKYKNSFNEDIWNIRALNTNTLWGLKSILYKDTCQPKDYIRRQLENINGRVIVYFSPIYQNMDSEAKILDDLDDWFDIGPKQTVKTSGIQLSFYEMYKKQSIEENNESLVEESKTITEKDIEYQYYQELQTYALESTNQSKAVEKGDTIAITVACYDEDKGYINTGYSPKGTVLNTVTLGTGTVISEIEEAIIGHQPGDIVNVTYKFEYPYKNYLDFSGKTINFHIQINSLIKELPTITDEWMQSNMGYLSIEEYKKELKEKITR